MESEHPYPGPDQAASALADADRYRAGLASAVALPSGHNVWIGAAVALQVGTAAVGIAIGSAGALSLLAAGVLLFGLVAGVQLYRFRRLNGIWLHGFASRAVLGTAPAASVAYAAALAAAVAAAFQDLWWLVGLCALAGGLAYALGGRQWMRAYRADPAANARGESVVLLCLIAILAVVGLGLLVVSA
jgi:hypothetical protein